MPDDISLAAGPRALRAGTAGSPASAGCHPDAPGRGDTWDIGQPRWDLFYAIVFTATVVIVETGSYPAAGRITVTAALAAMLAWYLLVGRPHIRSGRPGPSVRGWAYVAGMLALFALAASQQANTWYLAFALIPQCYQVVGVRRALPPAVVLNLIGGASVAWAGQSPASLAYAAGLAAFGTAFAVVYAGYITGIVEQSEERAGLITQLEATRAELAAVSMQAGALAERHRLAGDIHDTLAQGFSSILMLIQAAGAQVEADPATARAQLEMAAQTARENLAEARTLVSGLAPAQLQAGTLTDALRRLAGRSGAELGITASFTVSGDPRPLPAATEVVLLRAGQEALANVRKHAAASSVSVGLNFAPGCVRLEVTDDGAGFDVPAAAGYGLAGMRARLAEAGGKVDLRSAPGHGTSVLAEVPG